ncbi:MULTISPECIES: hypothetical protein [unclassified Paraburkholderia]|uniref:hypothetical protein n=1 Tax=unclassified Paraburkholderia TaxID=2615204 RepID=UPI002AB31755|nr:MULTISPECIES: hypothetical protein [unclassified Paraburkholderia]
MKTKNYVAGVRRDIVRQYHALAGDPTLRDRLNEAYAQANALGFTHDGPIVDFLYVEANTPGFYKIPAVAAWLDEPGVPGKQRFETLLQVMHRKQRDMKEKH